jgi:AmiR/NasT family two-component response regulator
MIYELRRYWLRPGKEAAWHRRLEDTLARETFERHGVKVVGVWKPSPADEKTGDVVLLLRFDSREGREKAWAALTSPPSPPVTSEREARVADEHLETDCDGVILDPTSYSPLP